MTTAHRPGPLTRRLLRAPSRLYDWHCGWLLGHRFLRLTHVGRHSGRHYRTVLEILAENPGTGEATVIAGLGPTSDWYRNIQARPAVEIAIGRRRYAPTHRILGCEEAAAALADYERRHRLAAPVIRRALSRLVGWTSRSRSRPGDLRSGSAALRPGRQADHRRRRPRLAASAHEDLHRASRRR